MTPSPASQLWQEGRDRLEEAGVPLAGQESRDLLAHLMEMLPSALWSRLSDIQIPEEQESLFLSLITRRCQKEPFHYLIGEISFLELKLKLGPHVLIPRPETEELAQILRDEIPLEDSWKVLDLCCGSGCLGLSLKSAFRGIALTMADISDKALQTARENCQRLRLPAECIQSDLGSHLRGNWNLIVCNPPYLSYEQMDSMEPDVLDFEPHIALFCGQQGLFLPKRSLDYGASSLADGGFMAMEMDPSQGEVLATYAHGLGFFPQIRQDFTGRDRFLLLRKGESWH